MHMGSLGEVRAGLLRGQADADEAEQRLRPAIDALEEASATLNMVAAGTVDQDLAMTVETWVGLSGQAEDIVIDIARTRAMFADYLDSVIGQPETMDVEPRRSPTSTGIGKGWLARVADNGKGEVFQKPGSPGNADMVRVMRPTPAYPDGYVRFYNERGQPVGLDGKPGPNSRTHIPLRPDGTYPTPQGWKP